MTTEHPITPPPELVERLRSDAPRGIRDAGITRERHLVTAAARRGADQELEECEKYWMTHGISPEGVVRMREHRRPRPPSLAEQALKALQDQIDASFKLSSKAQERVDLICAALKRLQELEEGHE